MRRIDSHKLRQHLVKLQPQPIETTPQDPIRRLCFLVRVRPRIDEGANSLEPSRVTDRDFQKLSRRSSLDTKHAHAIATIVFQMDRREISDAIRCEVLVRIAHFVNQLLFDTRNDDPATSALVLRDHKRPIRRRFNNRKSDVSKVWNAAPLVLAVTTRGLCATLDDVTRDRSRRKTIPIVVCPAKLMNQRRERQTSICRSTRDNDLRALVQRL